MPASPLLLDLVCRLWYGFPDIIEAIHAREETAMLPDSSLQNKNDTLKTISNRHSVRSFLKDDVSEEEIAVLLHAANAAPSAHNQQAWRFIILRGEKKQELAQLVNAQSANFPRPAAALLRMGAKSIISAPVVIAVANTGDLIRHGTELFKVEKDTAHDFFRTMEIQSSAAAVENILHRRNVPRPRNGLARRALSDQG